MTFGLGVLRLSPREFWSMTPRELFLAAQGFYGPAPEAPPVNTLRALINAHFDRV
jgi:uncharacterized phage protein (TIGR02216 family)